MIGGGIFQEFYNTSSPVANIKKLKWAETIPFWLTLLLPYSRVAKPQINNLSTLQESLPTTPPFF